MYDSMPAERLCCAYLRKSREDEEREKQGRYKTLERHKAILESLSSDNGHKIAQWYPEIVSGETIEGRPEVKKLLADLANGMPCTWWRHHALDVEAEAIKRRS